MSTVTVEVPEVAVTVEVVPPVIDIPVTVLPADVTVEVAGAPGPAGEDGPPGPTAVSADVGNTAVLGTDGLIFVPLTGVLDGTGAAGQIGLWLDPDTLTGSTRLTQDAAGKMIVVGDDLQGYGRYGLELLNASSGGHTVLQAMPAGGLYITDRSGQPQQLVLGTWGNPNDGSQFLNSSGWWKITAGRLVIGNYDFIPDAQLAVVVEDALRVGLVVRGAPSQAGRLMELQDASGVPVFWVDKTGGLHIDAGPGAGVPLITLRTNNGSQVISSDASSYTTFSNGIVVPTLFTGGIGFTGAANVDFNNSTLSNVGKLLSNGTIKSYADYNGYPAIADMGIVHRYDNNTAGSWPQAAFQAYKNSDPAEQPFLVSSRGFMWLRNQSAADVVFTVQSAPNQSAMLMKALDASGNQKFAIGVNGDVVCTIVRVPGVDIWNDGTIYFQAQSVSLGSVPGALRSNSPLLLPGDPVDPLHAATKQYVDGATVLPPEVAVIWDGVGAPGEVGLDGDYYLDTAGHVLYGPKGGAQIGGPTYSVPTSQASYDSTDEFHAGIKFAVSEPGALTRVEVNLSPSNTPETLTGWRVQLWDLATGALLERWDVPPLTVPTGSWQMLDLPSAWVIEAGKTYVLSIWNPPGSYRTYSGQHTGGVAGPLTLLAPGADGPNGVYTQSTASPDSIPATGWDGYVPACRPVFQGYDTSLAWPVAITAQDRVSKAGDTMTGPLAVESGGSAADVPLSVKGAPSQAGNLTQWKDASGTVVTYIEAAGDLRSTRSMVANYGTPQMIDFDADGRLYFGNAFDTNLYRSAADTLRTDDSLQVGGALTAQGSPLWKAWKGTQAEYDAIATKDPDTLYVVV